jgi:hypothetical protein
MTGSGVFHTRKRTTRLRRLGTLCNGARDGAVPTVRYACVCLCMLDMLVYAGMLGAGRQRFQRPLRANYAGMAPRDVTAVATTSPEIRNLRWRCKPSDGRQQFRLHSSPHIFFGADTALLDSVLDRRRQFHLIALLCDAQSRRRHRPRQPVGPAKHIHNARHEYGARNECIHQNRSHEEEGQLIHRWLVREEETCTTHDTTPHVSISTWAHSPRTPRAQPNDPRPSSWRASQAARQLGKHLVGRQSTHHQTQSP